MRALFWCLGLLNALLLSAHAALSYVEAGAAGYQDRPYGHIVFHTKVGEHISQFVMRVAPREALLRTLREAGKGQGSRSGLPHEDEAVLRDFQRQVSWAIGGDWLPPHWFIDFYVWPLLLSTVVGLLALFLVARHASSLPAWLPQHLVRWSCAFVVIMGFALPVLVPDFWLSFAWGRSLVAGANPYYDVPAQVVAGLPFDVPILRMTYGPLWALIAWAVTALTGGSVFWGAVAFKALLIAAWCAVIWLVRALVSHRPLWQQCTALIITGWLPLGPVQIGGDGHNDVLMVAGVLAWLLLIRRGHSRWATLALALSVSVKYVSAPLFLLDFLHSRVTGGQPRTMAAMVRAYLPNALLAVAVWIAVFAPFFESLGFFRETTAVREGYFYLPADGIKAIGTLLGVSLLPLALAVQAVFPVVTALCLWRYWRDPSAETLQLAAAGIMLSVLFVAAGHVWPWYVLWLSVVGATLHPSSRLARWSTGVALTAPFPIVVWIASPDSSEFRRFELPSLVVYTAALLYLLWLWRVVTPREQPAVDG
jgi:hypothetical protein